MTTRLPPTRAMATDSFRFCPPDSAPDGTCAFSSSSTSRSIASAAPLASALGTPCAASAPRIVTTHRTAVSADDEEGRNAKEIMLKR